MQLNGTTPRQITHELINPDHYPSIIRNAAGRLINQDPATLRRKQDFFGFCALIVMSSLMQNCHFVYRGKRHNLNLMAFVVGAPASDKGLMVLARQLAQPVDQFIRRGFLLALLEQAEQDENTPATDRFQLAFPKHFLNVSSSFEAFFDDVEALDGGGLLVSTEADAIFGAFERGYGNYSSLLRFTHSNEPSSRHTIKGGEKFISRTRFSLIMSGTQDQLMPLVAQLHNGLFSRFLLYHLYSDTRFENPFQSSVDVASEIEASEGAQALLFWKALAGIPFGDEAYPELSKRGHHEMPAVELQFTREQGQMLVDQFAPMLSESLAAHEHDDTSVIKRLSLDTARVACILHMLRLFEQYGPERIEMCFDRPEVVATEELELALRITLPRYTTASSVLTAMAGKPAELLDVSGRTATELAVNHYCLARSRGYSGYQDIYTQLKTLSESGRLTNDKGQRVNWKTFRNALKNTHRAELDGSLEVDGQELWVPLTE